MFRRSESADALSVLTSPDMCRARRDIATLGGLPPEGGSPADHEHAMTCATQLLWALECLPTHTSRQRRSRLSRHVHQTTTVLEAAITKGWIDKTAQIDVVAANESMRRFDPSAPRLTVPEHEPFDACAVGSQQAEEAFKERRRLAGTAAIFWLCSAALGMLIAYSWFMVSERTVSWSRFWGFWQAVSTSMNTWRSEGLALMALVVAIFALPLMTNTASPWGRLQRRGQQLLLQPIAGATLLTLSAMALMTMPVRRVTLEPGHTAWPIIGWITGLGISVLSCIFITGLVEVSDDERFHILAEAQHQITQIGRQEAAYETTADGSIPRWSMRVLSLDGRASWPLLVAVAACAGLEIYPHGRADRLGWLVFQVPLLWLALEYALHTHLLETWNRSLTATKRRSWRRPYDSMAAILVVWMGMGISIPVGLNNDVGMFVLSWLVCVGCIAICTIRYRRSRPRKEAALRLRHFQGVKSACESTVQAQYRYLDIQ